MTHRANLSKHINELLVLARLREGPAHGYEIALAIERDSRGAFTVQHGTLYPILHRLEGDGLIEGRWERSGRRKKTYHLTERGRKHLEGESREIKSLFLDLIRALDVPSRAHG